MGLFMTFYCFVILTSFNIFDLKAAAFSYDEQDKWDGDCQGENQSPINIYTNKTIKSSVNAPKIVFTDYDKKISVVQLQNFHNSVKLLIRKKNLVPTIELGKKGKYELQEIHFHWGETDCVGSEHTLNAKRYSLEMHMVHKNIKYTTIDDARANADGLAVIGILYKAKNVYPTQYNLLDNLFENVKHIIDYNDKVSAIFNAKLSDIFKNLDPQKYYTYAGSLTTPPCSVAVTWIVLADMGTISSREINFLRSISDEDGNVLENNYRSLQIIGNRKIYRSFK